MSSIYNDDSLTLHTDLYQINMMKKRFSKRISENYHLKMDMRFLLD